MCNRILLSDTGEQSFGMGKVLKAFPKRLE